MHLFDHIWARLARLSSHICKYRYTISSQTCCEFRYSYTEVSSYRKSRKQRLKNKSSSTKSVNLNDTRQIITAEYCFSNSMSFLFSPRVFPEKLGRGVKPASQNPYPTLKDQNQRITLPIYEFHIYDLTLASIPCSRSAIYLGPCSAQC